MKKKAVVLICMVLAAIMACSSAGLAVAGVPATAVYLNMPGLTLGPGQSFTLVATIVPENATDKTVKWSSSNSSIATVSAKGVVKAVKAGKATITAKSSNGNVSAKCTLTVTKTVITNNLPLSKSGETLTIAANENSGDKTLASGLAVFKEIEKKTGVKIKWEPSPAANYDTVMSTRFSSGLNLPDIAMLPSRSDPVKLASDGMIIEIGSLIRNYAPNITRWLDKEPTVRKCLTTPDGKLYVLPGMITEDDGAANDVYNILAENVRKDWLDKLNLKIPETLGEFHDMLVAFKTKDPNGNKKADEIAYTSWFGLANIYGQIGYCYGLHLLMNNGFYADRNGKVQCEWTLPKAKEMLATLNKWYKEGLLDPIFMTPDTAKWNAQLNNGLVGAMPLSTMYAPYAINGPMQQTTKNPKAEFIPIPPLKGPDGTCVTERSIGGLGSGYFGITKDCKNPKLAIRWLDYACFSEDGVYYNEWGVKGVSYVMKNGEPQFTDKILKSKDGITVELQRLGAYHYSLPQILTIKGRYTAFEPFKKYFPIAKQIYDIARASPLMPNVMSTADEAEKIQDLYPDISTYITETVTKIISGQFPLSDYDKFIKNLKNLKLDEYLKAKQDQYDRFMKF